MKILSLLVCAILTAPVVASAQNAPVPPGMTPNLPQTSAPTNAPAPAVVPRGPEAPRPNVAPAQTPRPAPQRPAPANVRPGARPGMPAPAPRIITSREPVSITAGETDEVVIYNGIRIGVPAKKSVTLSIAEGNVQVESPDMDGISIGNAIYNTTDPTAAPATTDEAGETPAPAPQPTTIFVSVTDGSVSVPKDGTPVYLTVNTGDVIEVNSYISLKGDVSGALSQEAPAPIVETPVETQPQETPAPAQPTPVTVAPQPTESAPTDTNTADNVSEGTVEETAEDFVENVAQEVEPSVIDETQGENIKEEEILSPSTR